MPLRTTLYENAATTRLPPSTIWNLAQAEGFEPTFSTPITVTEVEAPLGYACIKHSKLLFKPRKDYLRELTTFSTKETKSCAVWIRDWLASTRCLLSTSESSTPSKREKLRKRTIWSITSALKPFGAVFWAGTEVMKFFMVNILAGYRRESRVI